MNTTYAAIQIRAWTAVGAMTPEAIFARVDERVTNSFKTVELDALTKNFNRICDSNGRIYEPTFTNFMLSKTGLSPPLTKAVHILFDSLCYLSRVPLQTISTPPAHMTIDDLKRALMWMLPGREQSVVDAVVDQRIRSPADQIRLIFQSLANSNEKFEVPLDVRAERSLAVYNATTFPTDSIYASQNHSMHFDADGDEMYHDVLDVLASALPYIPVGYAEPGRDAFRPLAKQLYQSAPSLYELVIPAIRLKSFLSLLIATSFDGGPLNVDQDLECVVRCIAASFRQQLRLELPNGPRSIVPNGGTTWPMFHLAVSKLLPHLLNSLFKLLSKVFFDGLCPYDPHLAPTAEMGAVLTLPRMAQVECILYDSMYMSDSRLFKTYSGPTLPTAVDLTHSIESIQGWALLIISGRAAADETCIFGLYFADPATYVKRIVDEGTSSENTAMLFQLSPVHDAFRGLQGKLAWSVAERGVTFGHDGHGAALTLEGAQLKDAKFTHNPSENVDSTIYRPTAHRGRFNVQFAIEKIELWVEG